LLLASCGGVVVSKSSNGTLTANTQEISFGNTTLNTSSTQSIILTCTGLAHVTITDLAVSGAGFKVSGLVVPATLAPGQSAKLNVQFLPAVAGAATGSLSIKTTSSTSPALQIGLSGMGGAQRAIQAYNIGLTWSAPSGLSTSIAGYQVYRSSSTGSEFLLLTTSINEQTSFTDSDVEAGTTYKYYVTTVDALGNQSLPSNIAEVAVP
jgi:hypothetical protein